jgi:hypothetical protein
MYFSDSNSVDGWNHDYFHQCAGDICPDGGSQMSRSPPPPLPEPFLISGSRRSVNDYDVMNALLENQWFPAVMQMVMIPWILRKIQQFTAVLQ